MHHLYHANTLSHICGFKIVIILGNRVHHTGSIRIMLEDVVPRPITTERFVDLELVHCSRSYKLTDTQQQGACAIALIIANNNYVVRLLLFT